MAKLEVSQLHKIIVIVASTSWAFRASLVIRIFTTPAEIPEEHDRIISIAAI